MIESQIRTKKTKGSQKGRKKLMIMSAKKRGHNSSLDEALQHNTENCGILKFPDNIFLIIFSHLDTVSQISISKVCRKFHKICGDKTLLRTFDILDYPQCLKNLWKVSYNKLSQKTTSVHLKGSPQTVTRIMEKVTIPYMKDLYKRCPNLTKLSLHNFDLRELPLDFFPSNIEYLSLEQSMLGYQWFNGLISEVKFPFLKILNLDKCTKLSNSDLQSISYLQTLEEINLRNCYRISAKGIPAITRNLKHLKHINLSCCPAVNDVVLHYLSELNLTKLEMQYCHYISDAGIQNLFGNEMGQSLRHLDLYSCHELTDASLDILFGNSKSLKFLDIQECKKINTEKVDHIKAKNQNCLIRFALSPLIGSINCTNSAGGYVCERMNQNER